MDRLLLDTMLGKLSTYLRMCGYDAAYSLDRGVEADDAVLSLAVDEDRRLLTRDVSLAARAPRSLLLSTRDVEDQLRELRDAGFDLSLPGEPSRCSACNGSLERVPAGEPRPDHAPVEGSLWRCRDCAQYFWKGSHWEDVRRRLERVRDRTADDR
ncbi:MAG: Mut7-C RNAse domain-containing protein [Haloferacaceae archaeon]